MSRENVVKNMEIKCIVLSVSIYRIVPTVRV